MAKTFPVRKRIFAPLFSLFFTTMLRYGVHRQGRRQALRVNCNICRESICRRAVRYFREAQKKLELEEVDQQARSWKFVTIQYSIERFCLIHRFR